MEAMQAKHRLQVLARREQEKTAGIATVRKRLGKRHDAALRLDVALAQLSAAFAELEAADIAAFTNWPASLPSPHRYFRAETIEPLSTRRSQRMMAGPLRELVTRAPYDLAAAVLKRNFELTTELETAGLPALPAEDLVA
jgi:hypothetical protein